MALVFGFVLACGIYPAIYYVVYLPSLTFTQQEGSSWEAIEEHYSDDPETKRIMSALYSIMYFGLIGLLGWALIIFGVISQVLAAIVCCWICRSSDNTDSASSNDAQPSVMNRAFQPDQ